MPTIEREGKELNQDQRVSLGIRPGADRGEEATPSAPKIQGQKDEDGRTPEQLEQAIQEQLVQTIEEFELESDSVRRHHVRRLLKHEEYWKANQHLIWNERQFRWYTPFEKAIQDNPANSSASQPRFQYVNNIYRAWGLSIMAAVSQKIPYVQFLPKSSKSERDVATARAASDVMDIIERNNDIDLLAIRCAYLMWTQGLIGAYVRFVVDEDFGTHDEPEIENQTQEIAPDRYICTSCSAETPENDLVNGLAGETMGLQCPQCGAPLGDAEFHAADYADVPVVTGYKNYPDGQERISLYGALQLKMMPMAESLKQSLYLILAEEHHQAAIRAAHPGKLKEITAANSMSSSDTLEKQGRMNLAAGGSDGYGRTGAMPFSKMITYKRAWLRPEAFYSIDDEKVRNELLTRYPKGVRVVLADKTFLEAIPECVDDRWAICRPMPGSGMYTDSVGHDTIPVQDQFNDSQNVKAQHIEYGGAPPTLFDSRFIKGSALKNRRAEPHQWVPIFPEGASNAVPLEKMIWQPKLSIDANIYSYGKELLEFGQTISGAMPTIFGAPLKGNDTASGYSMAREQALGKLVLFWKAVKRFWSRIGMLAVDCFRRNRTEDYELVAEERSQQYSSTYIHLEDLKGNVTAHPDADEDFPTTWAEIRENILNLMKEAPDIAQKYLLHPANSPLLKKLIGSPEIVSPDEDNREKQYREIDMLQQGEPTPTPDGSWTSTVEPVMFGDNHDQHILTAQEWMESDKGMEAQKMNPAWFYNVQAHVLDHLRAKAQEQVFIGKLGNAAQAASAPPQPQGPGGPAGQSGQPQGGKTVGDAVEEALPGAGKVISKLAGARVQ